jgi:hypothetical protein
MRIRLLEVPVLADAVLAIDLTIDDTGCDRPKAGIILRATDTCKTNAMVLERLPIKIAIRTKEDLVKGAKVGRRRLIQGEGND